MTNRQRLLIFFLLSLAIVAFIFLAAALPQLTFQNGEPFPLASLLLENLVRPVDLGPPVPGNGEYLGVMARFIFWVVVPLAILYALISPEGRRQLARLLPVITGILLLAYFLRQLPKRERSQEMELALGDLAGGEVALPSPPDFVVDPPAWFLLSINLLLGLVIMGIIWFLWRRLRRRPDNAQIRLIQEAEKALVELQAGKDFRNTIIRCYAEMSYVLSEDQKVKRRQAMTPREFEQQLAAMGLDDTHIERLTRLFERTRYGHKSPTGREEREAVDCLSAIIRAYGKAS